MKIQKLMNNVQIRKAADTDLCKTWPELAFQRINNDKKENFTALYDAEKAMYAAYKLISLNSRSCWKRLSIIADEDVGQPEGSSNSFQIDARAQYRQA